MLLQTLYFRSASPELIAPTLSRLDLRGDKDTQAVEMAQPQICIWERVRRCHDSVANRQQRREKMEKGAYSSFFDEVSSKSVISGLVSRGMRL
jgi:hypothetical protein